LGISRDFGPGRVLRGLGQLPGGRQARDCDPPDPGAELALPAGVFPAGRCTGAPLRVERHRAQSARQPGTEPAHRDALLLLAGVRPATNATNVAIANADVWEIEVANATTGPTTASVPACLLPARMGTTRSILPGPMTSAQCRRGNNLERRPNFGCTGTDVPVK